MTSVDKRVVQMEFENSQFEQNIRQTNKSLNDLDENLKLKNATRGLRNIGQAAQSTHLKEVSQNVEMLKNRFTVMGQVGQAMIARVANAAMDLGSKLVRSVTIQPLTDGLNEYTQKLNSIKTIQTNTLGKASLDDINKTLDELNTYADKTIYNFAEMTKNIGTFTSAGVGLKQSAESIKGIANLAAASGASSAKASNAMYQLSQAIASGTVKLQDWNSVVNADMGGKLFQNALKRSAKAFGTDADAIIKKAGSFRESLQKGWITTEVLTKTLRNFTLFTEDMTEAQKKQTREMLKKEGYTEKQIKQIEQEAIAAEEAATKVKSFGQLIDTTKEALGSGWAQTWEIIIGNLTEAEQLWTSVSKVVNKYIDIIDSARNETLKAWKTLGGRETLLKGFKNIFEGIKSVLDPIWKGIKRVFKPLTGEDLAKASEKFEKFTSKLKLGKDAMRILEVASRNLATVFKKVINGVGEILESVQKAFTRVSKVSEQIGIKELTRSFKDFSGALFVTEGRSNKLYKIFKTIIRIVRQNLRTIVSILKIVLAVAKPVAKGLIDSALEVVRVVSKGIYKISKGINKLPKILNKFKTPINNVKKAFGNLIEAAKNIGTVFAEIFKPVTDFISLLVKDGSKGINNFADQFDIFQHPALQRLGEIFAPIRDFISSLLSTDYSKIFLDWSEGVLAWSNGLKEASANASPIQNLLNMLSDFGGKVGGVASSIGGAIGPIFSNIFNGAKSIGSGLKSAFDNLSPKIFSGLTAAGGKLKDIFNAIAPVVKDLADKAFAAFQNILGKIGDAIKNIDWSKFEGTIQRVSDIIGSFIDSLIEGKSPLETAKNFIFDIIGLFADLGSNIGEGAAGIPKIFSDVVDSAKSGELFSFADGIQKVADASDNLSTQTSDLGTSIDDNLIGPWKKVTKPIETANKSMEDIKGSLDGVTKSISDGESDAAPKITNLTDLVTNFKENLTLDKGKSLLTLGTAGAVGIFSISFIRSSAKAARSFAATSESLKNSITAIADVPKTLKGFQTSFAQAVKYDSIVKVAVALLAVAGALKLMSTIDPANLLISAAILLVFQKALQKFVVYFELIDDKAIARSTEMMIKFAASLVVFAVAMRMMASLSWEDIGKGLVSLGAYLMAIYLMLTKSNLGKLSSNVGTQVMKLSLGLLAIAATIGILGHMDVDTARNGIVRIMELFITLFAFFALLKKAKVTTMMIQLQGFAVALLGMIAAMTVMALMPFEKMIQGWFGLTMVLASLAAFSVAMKKFSGAKMAEIGAGILILAGALIPMALSLKLLSTIPIQALVVALGAMAVGIAILVGAATLLGRAAIPFAQFAGAMLTFTAATVGFGIGLGVIAAGLMLLSATAIMVGDSILPLIPTLLALAGVGAVMGPASIAFQGVARAILMVSMAALIGAVGILAVVGALKLLSTADPQKIAEGMRGVAEGFVAMMQVIGDNAQQLSESFGQILDALLNGIVGVIPKVAGLIVNLLVTILTTLASCAGQLVTAGLTLVTNILNGIASGIGGVIMAALNLALAFISGLAAGIRANRDQFGAVVVDLIGALLEAIISAAGQLISAGMDIVGRIVEGIMSAIGLGDLGKAAHEVIDNFIKGAGDTISNLLGWGQEASEAAAQGMEEGAGKASDSGAKITENAAAGIEENTDAPVTAATDMVDQTVGSVKAGFEDGSAADAASSFMTNISSSVGEGKDQVLGQFESFGPDISDSMSKGINPSAMKAALLSLIGVSFTAADKEGIKKAKQSGKKASTTLGTEVTKHKSSAKSGGSSVGKAVGDGMESGILSKVSSIASAAAKMVRNAISAAKKEAKVNSPSKVFIEIGKSLDEGLMVGIDAMADQAALSSKNLVKKTINAAENTMKVLGDISDDMDLSPTIRPVVDLSGIQSGVDAANSIFANQSALQARMTLNGNRFYDPNGNSNQVATKQVNNTISIKLDYNAGADANQIVRDIASGLMNQAFMEA